MGVDNLYEIESKAIHILIMKDLSVATIELWIQNLDSIAITILTAIVNIGCIKLV